MSIEIAPGWSGTLTNENMEQVAALMQEILYDKVFTYIAWLKTTTDEDYRKSHDWSEHTYLTKDVYVAQHKIWLQDNFGTVHLEPDGLSIAFDTNGQGFTIQEDWRPERTTYRYQYHVNNNEEGA